MPRKTYTKKFATHSRKNNDGSKWKKRNNIFHITINKIKNIVKALHFPLFITTLILIGFLISIDLFAIAILSISNPKDVAEAIFSKNMLIPLSVVIASATLKKNKKTYKSLISWFSVLYCSAVYLYLFYNLDIEANETSIVSEIFKQAQFKSFLWIANILNSIGLMVGFFGIVNSLTTIVVINEIKSPAKKNKPRQ